MLFKTYKDLIDSIVQGLKTGTTSATFTDYFQVIGTSVLIMVIIAVIIALIVMAIKVPKMFVRKMTAKLRDEINQLARSIEELTEEEIVKLSKLQIKMDRRLLFSRGIIIFAYLPVVVPTTLIIIDLLLKVF